MTVDTDTRRRWDAEDDTPRPEEEAADIACEADAAALEAEERPLRLYIAGRMTGQPAFNFPVFDAAVELLGERIDHEYLGTEVEPVSPAELDDPDTRLAALASPDGAPGSGAANGETWGDFLARDVKMIADELDAVALLPGWEQSKGARLEAFIARHVGKPVFYITDYITPNPREDWPEGWDDRSHEFWEEALSHLDFAAGDEPWGGEGATDDAQWPHLVELDDAELDRVFTLADLTTLQKIRLDEALQEVPTVPNLLNPQKDSIMAGGCVRDPIAEVFESGEELFRDLDKPDMRVIGLCGPAGAGKDEVVKIVQKLVAKRAASEGVVTSVKRQGFADSLKLSAARIFLPEATLDEALAFCNKLKVDGSLDLSWVPPGYDRHGLSVSGREFLQRYGTEAHREVFGEDFWLDAVLPEGRDDCDVLLVSDVRFENEARRVLERGGEVWRIDRPDVAPIEAHASEAGIPDELVTTVIDNSGTLSDLDRAVEAVWGTYERNT